MRIFCVQKFSDNFDTNFTLLSYVLTIMAKFNINLGFDERQSLFSKYVIWKHTYLTMIERSFLGSRLSKKLKVPVKAVELY